MRKNDLLLLLVSSVLLVVMWIAFNIVHNNITSTITETVSQQLFPINSTFDTKTINVLKNRIQISPDFTIASGSANTTPTPTPVPVFITPIVTSATSQSTTGGVVKP